MCWQHWRKNDHSPSNQDRLSVGTMARTSVTNSPENSYPIKWVREALYCELTGENTATLRKRRYQGVWIEDVHWRLGADRRVWINIWKAQEWVETGRAVAA